LFILIIGLLSSVPPLARWCYCVPIQVCPLLILWQRVTFGGGQVENGTSLSKSHLGKINLWDVQLSTSGWKECRRHRTFPVTRRLSTNRVPKKEEKEVFLGNLNPYWKPFWNMKPHVASHHLDTCSWEVWRKSIQGKWQKWYVVHVTKKQRLCDPFFRALSETQNAISLETCKA